MTNPLFVCFFIKVWLFRLPLIMRSLCAALEHETEGKSVFYTPDVRVGNHAPIINCMCAI